MSQWTMNKYGEVLKPDGRPVPVCGFASPLGNSPDIEEGKANGRLFFCRAGPQGGAGG